MTDFCKGYPVFFPYGGLYALKNRKYNANNLLLKAEDMALHYNFLISPRGATSPSRECNSGFSIPEMQLA
jgi:hypothetical protein